MYLSLHLRAASNWPLWSTVAQNSSSVQMVAACHVGAAVLVHVACSGRLDADLDERSFKTVKDIIYLRILHCIGLKFSEH